MKLKTRRILFSFFVLLFAVSAACVVLYANGYRYHPQKKNVEKTGELIIETIPAHSDIYLNDQRASSNIFGIQVGDAETPETVSYLPSGDYRLELRKEGYYPWAANIAVYSGRSTLLKDIRLLARQEPKLLIRQKGITALVRIDGTRLCYSAGNDIYIFNESNKQSERIYHAGALDQAFLMPSPRGTKLAIRDQGLYRIITLENGDVNILEHQSRWSGFQWLNEQSILATTPTTAMSVALPSGKQQLLFKGIIDDSATIEGASLLLVRERKGSSLLRVWGDQTIRVSEIMHFPTLFKSIESTYEQMIALRDGNNDLVLLDGSSPFLPLIQLPEGRLFWQSRNRFAITNDFELWIYAKNGAAYQSSLITRQSNAISTLFFTKETPYIFLTSNNKLKAIDISGISELNRYTLEGDEVGASSVSGDGARIYSAASFKGEQGLFEYVIAPQS